MHRYFVNVIHIIAGRGEIGSLREPGLLLTPSEADERAGCDGYLAASEIVEMRLKAEVVLLSACNTAAPGASSADGLSGLANSIFLAGTRNLLVPLAPLPGTTGILSW